MGSTKVICRLALSRMSTGVLVSCLLASCGSVGRLAHADRPLASRVKFPQAAFDMRSAVEALEPGTAVIYGVACAYRNNRTYRAAGEQVHLFPVTAHLQEWVEMASRARGGEVALMTDQAFSVRRLSRTDAEGRFNFSGLRPGKYYLFLPFGYTQTKGRNAVVGTAYDAFGTIGHFYERQPYHVTRQATLERFIEIARDGQVLEVPLTRGWGGLIRIASPCHA